jgi:CubicO group peptidase (beta-lactamase class C family)
MVGNTFTMTVLWLVGMVLSLPTETAAQSLVPVGFEEWIEDGMDEWSIPGMAVAVVKDGEVVFQRGFGKRKLDAEYKVDEHTVFGIASVSKNMTAAALAILVDEGKLHWDDRVVDHMPWFELSDPWVTSQVTVRDLLLHRVGVGRMLGNRLQFMTEASRDEVIYRMRHMDFEAPFRYQYVYSNVMYSAAGQLIEYIEGVSWNEFLENRLFMPLGMSRTNTSITQLNENDNVAWPHQEIKGEVVQIPRRNWDNAGPAGAVNSSVHDISQWMLMQLGEPGEFRDSVIISPARMNDIHRPGIALPPGFAYDQQSSYGLGWRITDYEGERILTHGGATDGFNTSIYLTPGKDLGIIVMTNTFNLFREAVVYTLLDHYLKIEGNDWHAHYRDRYLEVYDRAMEAREKIHDERKEDLAPWFERDEFEGVYSHPAYGEVVVNNGEEGLSISFWGGTIEADLEHWQGNTFRAVWHNPAQREEFCWFTSGKDGSIETLHFEFCLRPMLLQVGAYPSHYKRVVDFSKVE